MKNNLFVKTNLRKLLLISFLVGIFQSSFITISTAYSSEIKREVKTEEEKKINKNNKKSSRKENAKLKEKTQDNKKKLEEFIIENKNTEDKEIAEYVSEASELLKAHENFNVEKGEKSINKSDEFVSKISKNNFVLNAEKMNKLANIISGKNKLTIHGREKENREISGNELKLIHSGNIGSVNKGISRRTISEFDKKNEEENIKKIINNHDLKSEANIKGTQNKEKNNFAERDLVENQ